MRTAVRYYTRSGNTEAVAGAIAEAAGVPAVSVDKEEAKLKEPVDVLFVGGALYAYGLDSHLKEWLKELDGSAVKKAVIFSTSWISKHSIDLIRKALAEKGIDTAAEAFYVKNRPNADQLIQAADFARRFL